MTTNERIGVGALGLTVVGIAVAIGAWQWPKITGETTKGPSTPSFAASPPQRAILHASRSPTQIVSQNPFIEEYDLTLRNIGTDIAEKVILSCGILDHDDGSKGKVPPIPSNGEVIVPVYIPMIKGDVLHTHDEVYCPGEPIISYRDAIGLHTVSFDPQTGEAESR